MGSSAAHELTLTFACTESPLRPRCVLSVNLVTQYKFAPSATLGASLRSAVLERRTASGSLLASLRLEELNTSSKAGGAGAPEEPLCMTYRSGIHATWWQLVRAQHRGAPFLLARSATGSTGYFGVADLIRHIKDMMIKSVGAKSMRTTLHNKRISSTRHNDRAYSQLAKNRGDDCKNFYWNIAGTETFDQAEAAYYERNFGQALAAQNLRHERSRHRERIKTMDDYRRSKLTCPEESLYYIGRKGDTVSAQRLVDIFIEYLHWRQQTYPNVVPLDFAVHRDESGAPHIHLRDVWVSHSRDGLHVSQIGALKEMGVERPDTSRPRDRYNNPKQVYSRTCRSKFIEIAQEHGLDIETTPQAASKTGLSHIEYQVAAERQKLQEVTKELRRAKAELSTLEARRARLEGIERLMYEVHEREYDREHRAYEELELDSR